MITEIEEYKFLHIRTHCVGCEWNIHRMLQGVSNICYELNITCNSEGYIYHLCKKSYIIGRKMIGED